MRDQYQQSIDEFVDNANPETLNNWATQRMKIGYTPTPMEIQKTSEGYQLRRIICDGEYVNITWSDHLINKGNIISLSDAIELTEHTEFKLPSLTEYHATMLALSYLARSEDSRERMMANETREMIINDFDNEGENMMLTSSVLLFYPENPQISHGRGYDDQTISTVDLPHQDKYMETRHGLLIKEVLGSHFPKESLGAWSTVGYAPYIRLPNRSNDRFVITLGPESDERSANFDKEHKKPENKGLTIDMSGTHNLRRGRSIKVEKIR